MTAKTNLEREIRSQPRVLERLLEKESRRVERIAGELRRSGIRAVFLAARGSSDNAGIYAKYLFGSRNRLVVALAAPSLFTLYRSPPDLRGCLVLAVSQSGAAQDILQVVREGRRQGARTLVVTNDEASPLAAQADHLIALHAGRERAVAATKTYTAELFALAMLSEALRASRIDAGILGRVPRAMSTVLEQEELISTAAGRYLHAQRLAVIGRGYNYATAFELSLKLKELTYCTAEPYSSADFRHGPIAMVEEGFPVLLVACRGRTLADMRELARVLARRRADLVVISDSTGMLRLCPTGLPVPPRLPEWLTPLAAVVPGQLFAMHLAMARGCPLDRPRGLRKVTSTR